jgi:PAS domain S-box-containing protein
MLPVTYRAEEARMSAAEAGGTWTAAALALLDAVPDGVVVCDEEARLVHLHPLTEKIFGVASSAARGQELGRYLASIDDRPYSLAAVREQVERGPDSSAAAVIRHVSGVDLRLLLGARAVEIDGRRLWFLSLRPYPVAQPAPSDQDVYQIVFERSPVGLCHVDAHGVITAVNDAFAATIGSPRRVLVGLDTLTLPDGAIVGDIREALEGHLVRSQRTYRSATGNKVTQVQLIIAPIFDAAHQMTGAVIICTDVTAQVEARRALEQSLEALHRVMESAPDAIAVVREGRFALVNPRTVEMFGATSADEIIGRPAADFVHPDDVATLRERLQQLAAPLRPALPPFEYRMRRLDGRIVRVETNR